MRGEIALLVESIQPHDALEEEHIAAVQEWIASGAELFRIQRPDIPPQHLVSYCMLVDLDARKILLADHRLSGLWLPSGGHVEADEHPDVTASREMREELGIDPAFLFLGPLFVTVTQTTGTIARHTDVSLWYVLQGDCTQPVVFDRGEFYDVCWFAFDSIPNERTDPHMHRFVAKLEGYLNISEQ